MAALDCGGWLSGVAEVAWELWLGILHCLYQSAKIYYVLFSSPGAIDSPAFDRAFWGVSKSPDYKLERA